MGLYIGTIGLIYPNYFEMRTEDTFSKRFFPILALIGAYLSFWLVRKMIEKRKLTLSDWGIQYFVGKKLILGASWKNLERIWSRYPISIGAHEMIIVIKRDSDRSGWLKDYGYIIEYLSKKERITAFKKMAEFARKFGIEIKDDLGYLEK